MCSKEFVLNDTPMRKVVVGIGGGIRNGFDPVIKLVDERRRQIVMDLVTLRKLINVELWVMFGWLNYMAGFDGKPEVTRVGRQIELHYMEAAGVRSIQIRQWDAHGLGRYEGRYNLTMTVCLSRRNLRIFLAMILHHANHLGVISRYYTSFAGDIVEQFFEYWLEFGLVQMINENAPENEVRKVISDSLDFFSTYKDPALLHPAIIASDVLDLDIHYVKFIYTELLISNHTDFVDKIYDEIQIRRRIQNN